jgi:methylenetetrahydrofolate dehydrogenase (NADP+)/methenyltetrahydrofolate cyclohydrolase
MAKLINGKEISQQIKDELKEKVSALKAQGKNICLAVIQVGNDPASSVYVGNKKKACAYIGIESRAFELPEETTEEELLSIIKDLNEDDGVHGILVQLPVPKHINEEKIINAISPKKDVDGFHPESVGSLCIGRPGFVSCTPAGIIQLLKRSEIDIEGKHCVVIGRSNIVGKPMALLMLREKWQVPSDLRPECADRTVPSESAVPPFLKRRFYHRCLDRSRSADGNPHRDVHQSEPLS